LNYTPTDDIYYTRISLFLQAYFLFSYLKKTYYVSILRNT